MDNLNQNAASFGRPAPGLVENRTCPHFAASPMQLPRTELCTRCSNLVTLEYYRMNGQMLCSPCAVRARIGLSSDSPAAYVGALLFGLGGAIVGFLLYAGFTMSTHVAIGYVAVIVGWIVGRAMMQGSNGLGGGRYQLTALLLTYAAISLAAVPAAVYDVYNQAGSIPDLAAFLQHLLLLGVASPFLTLTTNPAESGISLAILCIGLRIAWQITRAKPVSVAGPYFMAEQ